MRVTQMQSLNNSNDHELGCTITQKTYHVRNYRRSMFNES